VALPIDTTSAVRGPSARLALVKALRDASTSEPETDWIEWKSEADLTAKAWQGELASHILGFANRDPKVAARNVEGYAYLLVGVEAGALAGVAPLDPAKLDDGLSRYLGGADGPRWEPDYIEVDGQTVLVITIEAPREGDRIFTLRKAFTTESGRTHPEGRIFVRRLGKTSPEPSSAEIEMLTARLRPPRQGLNLELLRSGDDPIVPLLTSPKTRAEWLEKIRAGLMEKVSTAPGQDLGYGSVAMSILGESRSPATYREEVDAYLDKLDALFPEIARAQAVERGVGRVALAVRNNSDENFRGLLVEIRVVGEVMAFFDHYEARGLYERPRPPRAWGSSLIDSLGRGIDVAPVAKIGDHGSIDNTASALVRYPVFDLRPGYERTLNDIFLIVGPERAGETLALEWMATSTSVAGSIGGTIEVVVAGDG
jgi:hypothetical protein